MQLTATNTAVVLDSTAAAWRGSNAVVHRIGP